MQISPSIALSVFIKHYLFLDTQNQEIKKLRLFSDGNTGMVFSFRNRLISKLGGLEKPDYLPPAFIYGQLNSFRDLYCEGDTSLMIVVFHPNGLNNLLSVPSVELNDHCIALKDLFGDLGATLQERLTDSLSITDKIRLAEDFFGKLITRNQPSGQSLINFSLSQIIQSKGLMPVSKLTDVTGCTERKLERAFIEGIGISPKRFSNIIKLHVFLKQLRSKSVTGNLTEMGHEAGYYDQPHLIREFKKYTGLTPGQYLRNNNPLAINFLLTS